MSDSTTANQAAAEAAAGHHDEVVPAALEPHPRRTDIDPKAFKRAERRISLWFLLSALGTVGFITAYIVFPVGTPEDTFLSNIALGAALTVALVGLGVGVVSWAKKLMSTQQYVQQRHDLRSPDEDRENFIASFRTGSEESSIARTPLLRRTLLLAAAILPASAVVLLRDLGPLPKDKLRHTAWAEPGEGGKGQRMLDAQTLQPVRVDTFTQVGAIQTVIPEIMKEWKEKAEGGLSSYHEKYVNELAKAPVILVRLLPGENRPLAGREDWEYEGVVAYSKICSHMGCPTSLYEQQTKKLFCPCHQSTFDVRNGCNVVFGPAARPLPQLAIEVDEEGYFRARGDLSGPPGPSFWERGNEDVRKGEGRA